MLDLKLSGKTAIVTGGSAGIGFACASALYGEGVNVVIVARNGERLEKAGEEIRSKGGAGNQAQVIVVQGDMTQGADIQRVVDVALQKLGKVDILVNNAGSARAGSFLHLSEEAFIDAWNLKLLGYIRLIKAVAPGMIERRDGRIVNIVGGAGRAPAPTMLPAGTTNAALLNLTRGLSKELGAHNVRINAISPGNTATARAEQLAQQQAAARGISVEEVKAERLRTMPLGKMVQPEEIAAMTLFLVSDLAASITGAEILIDAGAAPAV
jgi:NAD(P)-dependent dehydrogenase (short-subunit alcohol dehydrogenase family)